MTDRIEGLVENDERPPPGSAAGNTLRPASESGRRLADDRFYTSDITFTLSHTGAPMANDSGCVLPDDSPQRRHKCGRSLSR